jgi:hypothetical protein
VKFEIDKSIGYTTVIIDGQEVGVKFGSGAIRDFLSVFNIELSEVSTLFNTSEKEGKSLAVPKDPYKFNAMILWSGINYAIQFYGGDALPPMIGYQLLDQIGGIGSEQMLKVQGAFYKSLTNGSTPRQVNSSIPSAETEDQKKSETQSLES